LLAVCGNSAVGFAEVGDNGKKTDKMSVKKMNRMSVLLFFLHHHHQVSRRLLVFVSGSKHNKKPRQYLESSSDYGYLTIPGTALAEVPALPEWMRETQEAIEGMWTKLCRYYNKTSKLYAYVDATLLHLALKTHFMKRAGYGDIMIEQYV
jgi:hypothetical protein